MTKPILAFIVSALVCYFITPLVINLAYRIGAIDVPKDNRRVHKKPVPRLGGLAIFTGFGISAMIFIQPTQELLAIMLSSLIMVCMGIVDDTTPLKAKTKLFIQILCAAIVTWAGVRINFFTNPFRAETLVVLKMLSIPVTIFWIVGITNTVNLIDGLDGLAAGISAIAALTLTAVALFSKQYAPATLLMCVAGVVGCPYDRDTGEGTHRCNHPF